MRKTPRLLLVILPLLLLSGAASASPAATQPSRPASEIGQGGRVDVIVLSHEMDGSAVEEWKAEALRRFEDPVIVLCHGGPMIGSDQWSIYPDAPSAPMPVETLARLLRTAFPGRPIVLMSCNALGSELHGLPGVYYAKHEVWIHPDQPGSDDPSYRERDEAEPQVVGSIFEFVEAR